MWFGLLMSLAHAGTLRATVEWTAEGPRLVHTTTFAGALPVAPGDGRVIDEDGQVIATFDLPPLASTRAVVTPEGHAVGKVPTRFLRVDVPWPDGARWIEVGDRTLDPLRPHRLTARQLPPPELIKVRDVGEADRRMDIVVLADGFQEGQEHIFEEATQRVIDHLLEVPPYDEYGGLVNVWRAFYASPDVGVDNAPPPVNEVDTPFQCHYGCDGVGRLVCCDEEQILATVARDAPMADGVLVLVNSDQYGGSGGYNYATAYIGNNQPGNIDPPLQVAAHELAHGLVLLWDEYQYGSLTGDAEDFISPNCVADGETPPWQAWIGPDNPEIGRYPGCSFANWSRPTQFGCMMYSLQDAYCKVCREHLTRSLVSLLGGFARTISPSPDRRIDLEDGEAVTFEVDAWEPPHGLTWSWTLDGEEISTDKGTLTLDDPEIKGELALTLADDTEWVRNDPDGVMSQVITWKVNTGCGCDHARPSAGWLALGAAAWLRRRARR